MAVPGAVPDRLFPDDLAPGGDEPGGFEGTVLGTLVMPYCSGMGNLIFAFILGQTGGTARR